MSGTTVSNLTPAEREKFGELLGKIKEHVEGCERCSVAPDQPADMCPVGSSLFQCWDALLQAWAGAEAFDRAFK